MQELLDIILQYRTLYGWSEYQLSEQSGIPQSTISSWYCRGITPSLQSLKRICEALGITLSQLFSEVEGRSTSTCGQACQKDILQNTWESLSQAQKQGLLNLLKYITIKNE